MAKDLSYPTVGQTDLDKFYIPQGHIDQFELGGRIQKELLRVLENTKEFVVTKNEEIDN